MPYLSNGSSGVLLVLIMYKEAYKTNIFDKKIKKIAKSLEKMYFPKACSFYNGLAGFIYVLTKYFKLFSDQQTEIAIKKMVNEIKYYTVCIDDLIYIISPNFRNVSINFKDGNKGVINVLQMVKRDLDWN